MSRLEIFTLSLVVGDRTSFIDGTHLNNDILSKMPHLRTFTCDIVTEHVIMDKELLPTTDDVRYALIQRGYNVDCYIDYYDARGMGRCHIYSLPFTMERLHRLTNNFSGDRFMNVRRLTVGEAFRPFKYDFFVRISEAFSLLKELSVLNWNSQTKTQLSQLDEYNQISSILEFSHLIILDVCMCHIDYVKQFLFDSNTRLPCLNTLHIAYDNLLSVTQNFTNNAVRVKCSKVRHIFFDSIPMIYPGNFYDYFSLL
jgi:hypothetical protein